VREASLVARRNERGEEVLVVHRPIIFTLEQTARAMHAVVDPHLARIGAHQRVGRSRVRDVLRTIATDGWPSDFVPDPERVRYWRRWLLDQAVFTDDSRR
jgi:hypothetical protein